MESGPTEPPMQPERTAPAQGWKDALPDALPGVRVEEIETAKVVPGAIGDAVEASPSTPTKAMRHQWWIQFTALSMASFLTGWIGGMVAPIIPRLQESYNVGYSTLITLILILFAVGHISGAGSYVYLADRFGFGMMTVGASILIGISTAIQAFTHSFPSLLVSCLLMGFGFVFLGTGSSAFIATLAGDTSAKMSIMYAAQGVGSTCAPLAVTPFVRLPRWRLVFLFPVGFCLITAIGQAFAFKFKSQEECLRAIGQTPHKPMHAVRSIEKYKKVLRLPAAHAMALFQFIYAGFELTFVSWIVTFVLQERHGGPNAGYVSSGYWGGYTVGRLVLIPLTKKLGTRRAMFVYLPLSLGLQLVIWLVPSFTVTTIAITLFGLFLGPVPPIIMAHVGHVLPPELVAGAISWMALGTSAGSVVFPFVVGTITSRTGIHNLPPIIIAMLGTLLVIWGFVPQDRVRSN